MYKLFLSAFLFATQSFAALPPTTVKPQSGSKETVFNFQVPHNQAVTTASVTKLIETGNENLITNGGFEHSTYSTGWTASGGSSSVGTSSDIGTGAKSYKWNASASAQTLSSTAVTIPAGLYANNGEASCRFKTTATDYEIQVYDGTNILAEQTITATTNFSQQVLYFPIPSSGTVLVRVYANSDAAEIVVDDCYIGQAKLKDVSQASLYGAGEWATVANCAWVGSANTTWTDYTADTDCNNPTVYGNASAPATKIPGLTFASLPPGEYQIVATGFFYVSRTATNASYLRFSTGSSATYASPMSWSNTSAESTTANTIIGRLKVSSALSNVTIQFQYYNEGASDDANIVADGTGKDFAISVYRFPTASEMAIRSNDEMGWYIDANIGGANTDMGASDQASYVEITNSSLDLVKNSGSAPVGIACASGTASVVDGLTCSSNESMGITFNVPAAGTYKVCTQFTHYMDNSASSTVDATFQLAESSASSSTITQEGKGKIPSNNNIPSQITSNSLNLCGVFVFSSAGQKTVRLYYEQDNNNTPDYQGILADRLAGIGQRDMHWTVERMSPRQNAPLLVGSVTSNSSGAERMERAEVNCDAGSSITSQSGSWLSAIGNRSGSGCSITIASGIFSAAPVCTFTVKSATVQATSVNITSSTAGTVYGASADYDGYLICMGPR